MRIAESAFVFQSEAEHPVHADMRKPDRAKRNAELPFQHVAANAEYDRQHRCVERIIELRTEPRAAQIAGRAKIGSEDQGPEQPPRNPELRIDEDAKRK